MIDLHCHILFGVDDGPQQLEDSLALAKALVADGITRVVTTSHILEPPLSTATIQQGIAFLEKEFADQSIALELIPGGEIHYTVSLEEMRTHTINGGRYLLLEFPHGSLPSSAGELIFSLRTAGLIPIIAHPERNGSLLRDPGLLEPLLEQGALAQLTAASLAGDFGSPARQCARFMLKKGMAHFIATDSHGADWRPPRMSAGIKEATKLLGKEAVNKLVFDNALTVIEDREWND
ncbi:MAG: hypothetical protein L3J63_12910 [Geopsychrobacter sp.]|nr:hypothetical protein [Geopsychrobacter sp.]